MNNNGSNGKKNVSALGLAPLQVAPSLGLAPFSPSRREITREEDRVLEAFYREELIIDLTAEKGKFGMRKLGEVQQTAADLFGGTVTNILDAKNQAKGVEAQAYVDEFTLRQIQMYARHMLGTLEVVGTNIGMEVHRSLNLPPEQVGFWQKLVGRR
jgi:hypothetical protein